MFDEKAIEKAMRTLDLTREEAIEMLQEDEEIDRGANPHPLTPEQEKASKTARITSTGPRTKPTVRERKPNEDKRFLIEALATCLFVEGAKEIERTNIERQIDFTFNGTRYRIVLSAHRK